VNASRWPALGLLPLVAACFTQAPIETPVPAHDMRIVAQVTDTGVLAMSNALGPGAREVEGIVAGADATSWDLRLLRVDIEAATRCCGIASWCAFRAPP